MADPIKNIFLKIIHFKNHKFKFSNETDLK